jgi:23S rRNA (guanine745-N1)-methyltransferase
MHAEVVAQLRCPVCRDRLAEAGTVLRCPVGHSFDLARQGYVNLLTRPAPAGEETAAMVQARAAVQAAGVFAGLTAALLDAVPVGSGSGLVLDVGAGTGHQLAAVLDRRTDQLGVAVDLARAAARLAARAHPRADAMVADVWHGLPLADGCIDLALTVFAPRNGAELARVLRPDGTLLVVSARGEHLVELVEPLGMVRVDPDKDRRLDLALGDHLRLDHADEYASTLPVSRVDAGRLVAMGPSAHHVDPAELDRRLAGLPDPVPVTLAVRIATYHR